MSKRPVRSILVSLVAFALMALALPGMAAAAVSTASPAIAVDAGYQSSCAVRADGTVWCWGDNTQGMLGDGTTDVDPVTAPMQVSGISTATAVGVGETLACALLSDQTVSCWGASAPHSDGTYSESDVPLHVTGLTNATSITVGANFACSLVTGGGIMCWGPDNSGGVLGDPGSLGSAEAVPVFGITTATAVSAGQAHACATLADHTAKCWGTNGSWQLGDGGVTLIADTPIAVSGLTTAVSISAGRDHSCALLQDGTMDCWGTNIAGRVGDGTTTNRAAPVPVVELDSVASISAGYLVTCATKTDHTIRCWGFNRYGEIGDGTPYWSLIPVATSGISTALSVSAGNAQTCAVLADGSVRCWGYNANGQVGDGTTAPRFVPTAVLKFPPTVTGPVVGLRSGAALVGNTAPATVTWKGGDGSATGIASYNVGRSTDGVTWGPSTSAAASPLDSTVPIGGIVQYRAQSVDLGGTFGAWSPGPATVTTLVQQTSATYAGTWATASSSSYSGGSVKRSATKGASAVWKATARSFAIVATKGKLMGKVTVYLDGKSVGTIDLYRSSTQAKAVVWAKTFAVSGSHTIKIVVAGTAGRPTVELDAFLRLS